MNNIIEKINQYMKEVMEAEASKGKVKVEVMVEKLNSEEFKAGLEEALKEIVKTEVEKQVKAKVKRQRKTKLKDPNAPKKPLSPFFLYSKENREKVKEANPELKAIEIARKLGGMWKDLTEEEKEKYVKKNQKHKKRYEKEMESYERPSDEELAQLPENNKKPRSRKSKESGDEKENRPKRVRSAYIFFCQDMRPKVKEENPEMDSKEITRELGRLWQEAKEKGEVNKWEKKSSKDKERYEKEMENHPELQKAPKGKSKSKSKSKSDDEQSENEGDEDE